MTGGHSEFVKNDANKARTDLLPPRAMLAVSRVLAYGAKKYGANNWRKCSDPDRFIGAALRHVFEYMAGKRHDEDTGESPLAHAICCLMFIVEMDESREP